jgi:hypothetical protein
VGGGKEASLCRFRCSIRCPAAVAAAAAVGVTQPQDASTSLQRPVNIAQSSPAKQGDASGRSKGRGADISVHTSCLPLSANCVLVARYLRASLDVTGTR